MLTLLSILHTEKLADQNISQNLAVAFLLVGLTFLFCIKIV